MISTEIKNMSKSQITHKLIEIKDKMKELIYADMEVSRDLIVERATLEVELDIRNRELLVG